MNAEKVKFEFIDRAAIGPNVMRFATTEKENSILSFFKKDPSEKMLEFLRKMGAVIKLKGSPETGQWLYEVEASLDDIKEIIAFSEWGLNEINAKSTMADQTKGLFCFWRNEVTKAYLKTTGQKPLEAGIACIKEGYRLMTKQDYIDGINALRDEMHKLEERLDEIPKEMKRIAKEYANLHLPETGLKVGEKTTVIDYEEKDK